MKKEIIFYSVAGVLTTGLNYLVFAALAQGLHIHYMAANTVAWCVAVVFAYIVNRKYVFCSTNCWEREVVLFSNVESSNVTVGKCCSVSDDHDFCAG